MKKLLTITTGLALLLGASTHSLAQPKFFHVAVMTGFIRNLYPNDRLGITFRFSQKYSFYPELQIGGSFVPSNLFSWTLYLGYWDDGVDEPFPIADMITYSYNSFIIGTRLGFRPSTHRNDLPVQPEVFVGFSHHFIGENYVAGGDFSGNIGRDSRSELNYAEVGIQISRNIKKSLQLFFELQQAMRLGKDKHNFPNHRRAYKVGLAHSF